MTARGLIFHVVNRAAKRARLFSDPNDYAAFEQLLAEAIGSFDVEVFAYCVMPTHWHLLLMPLEDGSLPRFMHWLTTTHARRWQLAHNCEGLGAVYQGRFKSIPVGNDEHFLWVTRYVERNALRANLVTRAEEWRWSSLWRRARLDTPWLATWPVPVPSGWVEHVNRPQTDAELAGFRGAMQRNEPFGTAEWRQQIEGALKSRRSRPRGRPRRVALGGVL